MKLAPLALLAAPVPTKLFDRRRGAAAAVTGIAGIHIGLPFCHGLLVLLGEAGLFSLGFRLPDYSCVMSFLAGYVFGALKPRPLGLLAI